jgi:hypothetical protein
MELGPLSGSKVSVLYGVMLNEPAASPGWMASANLRAISILRSVGLVNVDDGAVSPRCERIPEADIPGQRAQGFRRILKPRRYLLLRMAGTAGQNHHRTQER